MGSATLSKIYFRGIVIITIRVTTITHIAHLRELIIHLLQDLLPALHPEVAEAVEAVLPAAVVVEQHVRQEVAINT